MLKNGAAGFALREHSEDAHAAAAGVADQDIDGEHALEEVGPVDPTARSGVGLIGTGRRHDGHSTIGTRRMICGLQEGLLVFLEARVFHEGARSSFPEHQEVR